MSLFVLDTAGDNQLLKTATKSVKNFNRRLLDEKPRTVAPTNIAKVEFEVDEEDSEDDGDYFGLPPPNVDLTKIIDATLEQTVPHKTKTELELENATELVNASIKNAKLNPKSKRKLITKIDYSNFNPLTGKFDDEQLVKTDVANEMSKTTLAPGLEQLQELPSVTKKKQRALNRLERAKTKGAGWFNLPATERTEEIENDLKILQMRSVLDPKHFYKKNDLKVLPKYFQIGTVQHSPLDYYKERDTRKNKKHSLVEELLADADAQKYAKRKYKEIIARKDKYAQRKAMKKMKKLKKNK